MMKDLNNEGLIDSFSITNGTIKTRESGQSKPISITHESDLHSWGILSLMQWGYQIQGSMIICMEFFTFLLFKAYLSSILRILVC